MLMPRPLLGLVVMAACLAIAQGDETGCLECGQVAGSDDCAWVDACHTATIPQGRAFHHPELSEHEARRLLIQANNINNQSDGAILWHASNAALYGMNAADCWSRCQNLKIQDPQRFRHHNWAIGPVRSIAEREHIAIMVNEVWKVVRGATASTAINNLDFWPNTTAKVGAFPRVVFPFFSKVGELPNVNSIWIGHFGDAGQGNHSLPFYSGTGDGLYSWVPTWTRGLAESPDDGNPATVPIIADYVYSPEPSSSATAFTNTSIAASPFYIWLPFQTSPLDFSFTDWATGMAPPRPTVTTKTITPSQSFPAACTRMVGAQDPDNNPHGQWAAVACNSLSQACFCRAICSVAEAIACQALRECSPDGSTINVNYEYDYESCQCKPAPQKRCCTECDDELTAGRLVPTECRTPVAGDPGWSTLTQPEKDIVACRRIIFQGVPIVTGGHEITMSDNKTPQIRRDLPVA